MPLGRNCDPLKQTYAFDYYNEYAFGEELRPIETKTNSMNLFVEHNFSDSLSVVFTAPYMWLDSSDSGFQDANLFVKYLNQKTAYRQGVLSFISSAGLSFPLRSYDLEVARPIGERATILKGRLVAQYQFYSGFFIHLQSGIDFEVKPQSQGAIPVLLRFGFGSAVIYGEAWVEYYKTFNSASDTQVFGGNGSDWLKIGGSVYIPMSKKVGINIGSSYFLQGKNIGLSTVVNGGLILNFNGG